MLRGDSQTVKALLSLGANTKEADHGIWTAVHMSCHVMNVDCIRLLLSHGADVNARTRKGRTILCLATEKADRPDVLALLLDQGADIENKTNTGWRPLHSAALFDRPKNISFLVGAGVQINSTTWSGESAISIAIGNNNHEILKTLLRYIPTKHGHDQDAFEKFLADAIAWGDYETLEILDSADLGNFGFIGPKKRRILVDSANRRRSLDEERFDPSIFPPDLQPLKWYTAFCKIVDTLCGDQQLFDDGDSSCDQGDVFEDAAETQEDRPVVQSSDLIDALVLSGHAEPSIGTRPELGSQASRLTSYAQKFSWVQNLPWEEPSAAQAPSPGRDVWILVLVLIAICLGPAATWLLLTMVVVKGQISLTGALTRHPRFVDAMCVLLLVVAIVQQRPIQRHRVSLDNDLVEENIHPRLNRGLLWFSTPGFRINLKAATASKILDGYNRLVAESAPAVLTLCQMIGLIEPALEEGKCRVRWRCVSDFNFYRSN